MYVYFINLCFANTYILYIIYFYICIIVVGRERQRLSMCAGGVQNYVDIILLPYAACSKVVI